MPKPNPKTLKTIENMIHQLDDDMLLTLLDDAEDDDSKRLKQQLQQKIEQELANQDDYQAVQAQMQDTVLSLADYLNAVQLVINETFAHSVWVKAEIRNVSSKGGHYYFELADKDSTGKITASCRSTLWKNLAKTVIGKFEKNTGMSLDKGLNLLLKVTANFHPQYGFSLNILDIDPTFTLGDLAQQYQQMLTKLMEEGLLDLNKTVPIPFDIQHVLVIAPENAAGLGDFRADADRLAQAGACQFYYQHATFQGNHASQEIREAIIKGLKTLEKQGISPDILVIIRGGGAVGDLAYLNDYELAALIAEQSVPVWVGIGHERDHVILDEVAHTSFDTPSKVIAGIRQHLVSVTQSAKQLFLSIEQVAKNRLTFAKTDSEQQFRHIESLAKQRLLQAKHHIDNRLNGIKQHSFYQLQSAKQQTEQWRAMILLQHPSRVLSQGYAIVRDDDNRIVKSVNELNKNQAIQIELKDGKIVATIDKILKN